MKKNKRKILIIASIVIAILIIAIIVTNINKKNKKYNSVNDFGSIKELVEYYGCKYIGIKNSSEDGYEKDLYLSLMDDPIDEEGNVERTKYENIFKLISIKIGYINYRIIDESRNLTIRINIDEDKNGYYTVNGINNYFENLKSLYNINNEKEEKIASINIVSNELNSIINNDWIRKKAALGSQTSTCGNYDTYWNNGYKVRTINNKIFNIIFTKNYVYEVFQGIKTNMTNDEIRQVLGAPIFSSNSEADIIGYKFDSVYAFFAEGEISVYKADEYDESKNKEFAKLVTTLNKDGDYNTFLTNLTDLYPDYSNYTQEEDYVTITYPLRGFEVNFGKYVKNGITIYKNFKGNITEEITIDKIKENKIMPANIYIKSAENLVFKEEENRFQEDKIIRNPYDDIASSKDVAKSSKYRVIYNGVYSTLNFYSRDKENQDFEIRAINQTGIYVLRDNLFVYGIRNDGLYVINAETKQTSKIVDSNGECIINKIENNTIFYDDASVQI